MHKRLLAATVAALMILALGPGVASAHEKPRQSNGYYLSLGTSLAAGTLADETGASIPFSDASYTDYLAANFLGNDFKARKHVKLGCPGETTLSMITGFDDAAMTEPSACGPNGFDLYKTGTQLGDAIAHLSKGKGRQTKLITIDMGANDALQTVEKCGTDFNCIQADILVTAGNLAYIMSEIRAVYDGPIVAMNYYNPSLAAVVNPIVAPTTFPGSGFEWAIATTQLNVFFNDALNAVYAGAGVHLADVEAAFETTNFGDGNGNLIPDNVDLICQYISMCVDLPVLPNIHPTPEGYAYIADVFLATLVDAGIL